MNYRITNAKLLIHDGAAFRISEGDLFIKDGIIESIGAAPDDDTVYETVDAVGRLVMPGLINTHTHVYMTILRNYADDCDFTEWLFKRVNPVEDSLPVEAAYWTNLLGFAEMFRSGTTSYVDMHMYKCMSGKAAKDAGIRAFIGRGLVGDDLFGDAKFRYDEQLAEMKEYGSDLVKFILSPHAPYSCSEKLYRQVIEESERLGLHRQTHLSEGMAEIEGIKEKYGVTPVRRLYDIGFLSEKTLLAHCVQMQGDDIELIKNSGSTVVTNPASNAKLGNGFAPVCEFQKAGINVSLGTDGTSSNNTLNMFREMGLLSLIHKGIQKDSTAAPADYVLSTATVNGAKALGMQDQIGVIKQGAQADLIFLDLKSPSLFPNNNIISSLCYSANGSEVESVMINGRFVMRDRELLTIDYDRVCYEVEKIQQKYL